MINRRTFIQQGSLIVPALSVTGIAHSHRRPVSENKSIVVSTWNFGVAANREAWKLLSQKGRALDAVEAGVRHAEADVHNQSVGKGGFPDRDGHVTLDACIMDHNGNCGAVAALERITHAISVARMVMEKTPHIMLAGNGALQFALENGFKEENLFLEPAKKAWNEWLQEKKYRPVINSENKLYTPGKLPGDTYNHDTIGMLALDAHGHLAGACTTSGMAFKMHGRVGDSPIIGAGLYVDNDIGAATATGVGEEVIRQAGSFLVVELMRQGYLPEAACKEAVMRIVKKKPQTAKTIQVGFLALNKAGEYGAFALQKDFSYAVCNNRKQDGLISSNHYYK